MKPDLPYSAERDLPLGIPGFRYADLYEPARLKDLLDRFDAEVGKTDPALLEAFGRWRAAPDALQPPEVSDLLVRMAPHVSRFVERLFRLE